MTAVTANASANAAKPKTGKPAWVSLVAKYQAPSLRVSLWQLATSYLPFIALWIAMYFSLQVSYLLTLALAVLAGGFLMRIFIIQHDCGHTSFFKSKRMNDLVGFICGVFTMTPYEFWRTGHARHHATSGDLDFRGYGDVWTMTLKEYIAAKPAQRLGYRLYRHPLIMFGIGPAYMFIVNQRTPFSWQHADTEKMRRSLIYTDIALVISFTLLSLLVGFDKFVAIHLPIAIVAGTVGVFLFFVQHQFEDTYWRYHPEWDYTKAALEGSSYLKLPPALQWITGNIGLHHIHHLSPRIPNYLLEQAHNENPLFQEAPTLTLGQAFKIVTNNLALWEENDDRLISFKEAHERFLAPGSAADITPTSAPKPLTNE
jgi:omega-6 fatty acid desaturase (delta-12 desaturase)